MTQILKSIMECQRSLSSSEFSVLARLHLLSDDDIHFSEALDRLAEGVNLTTVTVRKALDSMIVRGVVDRVPDDPSKPRPQTRTYRLNLGAIEKLAKNGAAQAGGKQR